MALQPDQITPWIGRELFDADNDKIGTIVRLGYPRRRFGSAWLLVEIASGGTVLVPADQIKSSDDRLVLPYPKRYVETAPTVEEDEQLIRASERRLRLHWGMDFMVPGTACYGCGLCRANKRYQRMASS